MRKKITPLPDPISTEHAIEILARYGDAAILNFIRESVQALKADRTRFERLFPGKPVGNNLAILHFETILEKTGLR